MGWISLLYRKTMVAQTWLAYIPTSIVYVLNKAALKLHAHSE